MCMLLHQNNCCVSSTQWRDRHSVPTTHGQWFPLLIYMSLLQRRPHVSPIYGTTPHPRVTCTPPIPLTSEPDPSVLCPRGRDGGKVSPGLGAYTTQHVSVPSRLPSRGPRDRPYQPIRAQYSSHVTPTSQSRARGWWWSTHDEANGPCCSAAQRAVSHDGNSTGTRDASSSRSASSTRRSRVAR